MNTVQLDHERILRLMTELAERLSAIGVKAGIRVVGGAAIGFMDAGRRSTVDVDAAISPAAPVLEVARQMAAEHGLPSNWLNQGALAFVPPVGSGDWRDVVRRGDVVVQIASAELLLAMKLYANRGIRDTDDIEFLLAHCRIESVEEAQEIYERYHAQDVLTDSAAARVQAWLDSRR